MLEFAMSFTQPGFEGSEGKSLKRWNHRDYGISRASVGILLRDLQGHRQRTRGLEASLEFYTAELQRSTVQGLELKRVASGSGRDSNRPG